MDIVSTLLTPTLVALAVAVIAVLFGLGKIPIGKRKLRDNKVWRKLLPEVALLTGVGGAFMPGIVEAEPGQWGLNVVFGLTAGLAAMYGRKSIKRKFVDKLGNVKE